jgi:Zn-dependent protease
MGMVSIAGPGSNMLTAAVLALPVRAGLADWSFPLRVASLPRSPAELAGDVLSYAILFNVVLAVFNLIPLPPLDGFKALLAVAPKGVAGELEKIERFGPLPLLLLLVIDIIAPVSIIGSWVIPLANGVGRIVAGHPVF